MIAEKQVGRTGPLYLVAAGEFAVQVRLQLGGGHPDLLQQIGNQAVGRGDQGEQQMLAIHLLMRKLLGDALRFLQRFL